MSKLKIKKNFIELKNLKTKKNSNILPKKRKSFFINNNMQ